MQYDKDTQPRVKGVRPGVRLSGFHSRVCQFSGAADPRAG